MVLQPSLQPGRRDFAKAREGLQEYLSCSLFFYLDAGYMGGSVCGNLWSLLTIFAYFYISYSHVIKKFT